MAQAITDVNTILEKDHKYLLYFDLPYGLPTDISRKMSDATNFSATFANRFGKSVDFELLGTTIAQGYGAQGQDQLIAQIRITGTPLLAAVAPIVAIALIVAGVFLVIEFRKAIDTTVAGVTTAVTTVATDIGQATKDLADNISSGVQSIGEGLGSGLNYALPVVGVGISVLALIIFFGYVKAPRA